jgi:hypothetical protein
MNQKETKKFIDNIPGHIYEKGTARIKKYMKNIRGASEFDKELTNSIIESAKTTIQMATEVLLDVGAEIKWPEHHIKVGPKKYVKRIKK